MHKIQSIQALRFFAALLVVLDHALLVLTFAGSASPRFRSLAFLMGEMGVYIFFAISGFIMLITNAERFDKPKEIGGFLLRRIIRVAPIYWLFTTWVALAILRRAPSTITAEQILKSYLFIPVANHLGQMRPVHGVGWTLNYEMLFYVLFALAMMWRFKAGVGVMLGALVLIVLAGMALHSPFDTSEPHGMLETWASPILLLFGFGMLIGLARQHWSVEGGALSPWALCAIMVAPLIAFQLLDGGTITVGWRALAAATAVLLVSLSAFTVLPAGVGRFLTYGGDASYSLYLAHTIVIGALSRRLPELAAHNPAVFFVLAVLASLFAGVLVRHVVEKPLTRFVWAAVSWLRSLGTSSRRLRGASAPSSPVRPNSLDRKRTAPRN